MPIRPEFQFTRDAFAVVQPRKRFGRKAEAVRVIKVDPEVWALALELAGGDVRRLDVISSTEVRVRNR